MNRYAALTLQLALVGCVRSARPLPNAAAPPAREVRDAQARPALVSPEPTRGDAGAWLTGPDGTLPRVRPECIESTPMLQLGGRALTRGELEARPWLWGAHAVARCLPERFWISVPPAADAGAVTDALALGSLERRVGAVADSYLSWGRVDDGMRWAPFLCWLPPPAVPAPSQADGGEHARKLYFLYARYATPYRDNEDVMGQVVVKESWVPRSVAAGEEVAVAGHAQRTRVGGETVEPGRLAGLFVMLRARAGEPSDAGWLYATVSPQGELTASGLVASCMGCHQHAPHGRLFGLAEEPDAGPSWRPRRPR